MLRTGIAGLVGVLVGAAVVGVVTAQQEDLTAKVVRAERLEIVDEADGEQRGVFGLAEDGSVELSLMDEDGEVRARLALDADGRPQLALLDEDGTARATLLVSGDGDPGLRLLDTEWELSWRPRRGMRGTGDMMRRLEENRDRMTTEQYERALRYMEQRRRRGGTDPDVPENQDVTEEGDDP